MSMRAQAETKVASTTSRSFTPASSGLLQRKCACGGASGMMGECEDYSSKRLPLQRHAAHQAEPSDVPPIVHEVLRLPGQPLDSATRALMESRFGHDFSQVRVHADAKAAESARAVNALAYTVGRNVVFGAGQHAPQTEAGRRLLAHELAHTIQQSGERSQADGATLVGAPDRVFEREADMAAEGISAGSHIAAMTPSVARLQKKDPAKPEDIAGEALKAGPKKQTEKTAYDQAAKDVAEREKKGTSITRVVIPAVGKDDGVKGVSSSDYKAAFQNCGTKVKSETGLPKAFLCTTHNIESLNVAPVDEAKVDTNVRLDFKKSANGGSVWVVSVNLSWALNTAGFLDIDEIDTKMLSPYKGHEKGHSTIAHQIRDRLLKLMQAELERVLPTEQNPFVKSGQSWQQNGGDAIVKQISDIRDRYMNWFDELADAADSAWDAQEKETLSKIATAIKAKQHKPGSSVPTVPGE